MQIQHSICERNYLHLTDHIHWKWTKGKSKKKNTPKLYNKDFELKMQNKHQQAKGKCESKQNEKKANMKLHTTSKHRLFTLYSIYAFIDMLNFIDNDTKCTHPIANWNAYSLIAHRLRDRKKVRKKEKSLAKEIRTPYDGQMWGWLECILKTARTTFHNDVHL